MTPIYCPLCCDQPFEDQDSLFHHLRSLRNHLFCPICSERFSSFDYLITHLSRKCYGPESPREAKRRCLLNNSKLPDMLTPPPPPPPLDSPSCTDADITPNESTAVTSDSGVICNQDAITSPARRAMIPPEIRLPRGVTVSIGQANKQPLQNNTPGANPQRTLPESRKYNKVSPAKSVSANISLDTVLQKVSLNPNVDICLKVGKSDGSKDDRSFPPVSPAKPSPSVSIITNEKQNIPIAKSGTAGILSSKLVNNASVKDTLEVQKPILVDLIEDLNKSKKDQPSSNEGSKFENKIIVEANVKGKMISTIQGQSTKKRGRPRKYPIKNDNDKSPVMNGVMNGVNQDTSCTENPINRSLIGQNKVDSIEKLHSKSAVGREGKGITPNKELVDSDHSDHFECNDLSSDSDNSLSRLKEKVNRSETTATVPSINGDSITKKTSAESDKNREKPEKFNIEPEKSSSKTEVETKGEVPPAETKSEEEEEYTCSACDIRFTSIYEHIKEYHNGQEVVVEVPEEEIKEDLKAYQENSDSKISIGESESTVTPATEDNTPLTTVKEDKASTQALSKGKVKRKKQITGSAATGDSDDLVSTRTLKKVKKDTGEHWVQVQSEKKKFYQYVTDDDRYTRLMNELRNNTSIHPRLKMPVKRLFENPKINVVEITYVQNSPFFTHKTVDFKNPMPMFIVDRETSNGPELLGGIASYVMAPKDHNTVKFAGVDSKLIGVMKVILTEDKTLTVENLVFNDKPANPDMIPVLEDVKNPDIPLLKDAKILKWKCNRCLATTWKFPLQKKETHFCNACPICHKTFISPVSLKKHLVFHKRDGTRYCKDCQAAFVSKATLNSHLSVHITHILCDKCHLFVPKEKEEEHKEIHTKDPCEQFPCSVCKKTFGSGQDLKSHETKVCSKLVARFNCPLCDKKFYSQTALSYHTIAHTNSAIKLTCRFCPKTFIQEKEQCPKKAGKRKPSSFNQKVWHERIHTRDRPYICKSCPKRFRSLEHEMIHSAKAHSPTVPLRNIHIHMCLYCDRVFRSEKQLTNHMTQHTAATAE